MPRTSMLLLVVVAAGGCRPDGGGEGPRRPGGQVAAPRPVTLHYEGRMPADLPRVLHVTEADGSTHTVFAREQYAADYRAGWYECLDAFLDGRIALGGPEPKPAAGGRAARSAAARGDGFAQCLAALRRAAQGDEKTLRASLARPAWYERIEHYIQEDVRRQRREADGSMPEEAIGAAWDREAAFALLLRTDTFTSTAVGYAARTPVQLRAFRRLLDDPDAPAVFADLLNRGQTAGQVFALCGLYLTDHDRFGRAVEPFRRDGRRVRFFSGCVIADKPVSELVESRHPHAVRLRPGQTWAQWHDEFTARHGPDVGVDIDVIGGGWPEVFRNAVLTEPRGELAADQG